MKSAYIRSRLDEIEGAISKAESVAGRELDPEIQSFFARYIVVAASGVYEDCIERLFSDFARLFGDPKVTTFFSNVLDAHFRNPKYDELKKWLNYLDPSFGTQLDSSLGGSLRSNEALNSIVANKNQVAHGSPCTATLGDVKNYHKRIVPIFDAMENMLGL